MNKGNNVTVVMIDDTGPFVRQGSFKYRPPKSVTVERGDTVRAWATPEGFKVETDDRVAEVWTRG
jgi:hypothetical protein